MNRKDMDVHGDQILLFHFGIGNNPPGDLLRLGKYTAATRDAVREQCRSSWANWLTKPKLGGKLRIEKCREDHRCHYTSCLTCQKNKTPALTPADGR